MLIKQNIIIILIVLFCMCSIACGSESSNNTGSNDSTVSGEVIDSENKNSTTTTEEITEAETKASVRGTEENTIREVVDPYDTDAFGNYSLTRSQIVTITFLNNIDQTVSNAWDVSAALDGSVMAWTFEREDGYYDLYIAGNGGVNANENSFALFSGYKNVTEINFNDSFFTDNMKIAKALFGETESLTGLDLSNFNTSNVTDMSGMFGDCGARYIDISSFDTSNVEDMMSMFNGCNNLISLDLSGFDTSNVTSMQFMFKECYNLTVLNISGFDTSSVEKMGYMFSSCSSIESLDVSSFDTSNVIRMEGMFSWCESLKSLDVSNFDTSNVMYMAYMFAGCRALESLDLSNFDLSSIDYGSTLDIINIFSQTNLTYESTGLQE